MPARDSYIEFLIEQFSPLGNITARAMFGGYCLYCDGAVFALVANHEVYLKADDANRAMFEDRGLRPFKPFEDRDEVMSYYQGPPEIFEDPDVMSRWCTPSVEAGRRALMKKKPRKPRQARSRATTS
jgi:DNA transformation protein and related proteins